MDSTTTRFSFFTFELKIMQVKAVQSKPRTNLFVRCYLPLGNSNKMRSKVVLNTREIATENDLIWNEPFSLECRGSPTVTTQLVQESLVLELRMRKRVPVFGALTLGGSKILGVVEVPMKEVLESPNMVFDKWLNLFATRGHVLEDSKPAKLKVEIRLRVLKDEEMLEKRRLKMGKSRNECGCKEGHDHGCSYNDYDVFALASALEAF